MVGLTPVSTILLGTVARLEFMHVHHITSVARASRPSWIEGGGGAARAGERLEAADCTIPFPQRDIHVIGGAAQAAA